MSLYVFSTFVLSIIFSLVFSSWWIDNAPFKIHLSALLIAATTILSTIFLISIHPIFRKRNQEQRKHNGLLQNSWNKDISTNLSTPAAVINGYNLVFANKAFLTELGMLGMNDQIIGMPITNIIHPSDHQHLAVLFTQTSHTPENKDTMKLRLLCLDGSILPAHLSLSPLQKNNYADMNLLQFSSIATLKVNEFDYLEQANYQQLVNQIEQIVFHLNVNEEIIFLNTSWESLLDYKVQDCLNKPLISFIHPEDRPLAEARINSLIQGKRNHSIFEARLIGGDGDFHWVEFRGKNTTAYKGERSSVIGTLTDISQMKSIEATLRTNRRLLSSLINNIPAMIYRCKNDRDYSFEFVSDGCVEVTGYEPYEMVDNPNFSYMKIIYPEDRAIAWDSVQNKVIDQKRFQLIYRIITRSGEIKWVWEHGKGIFSSTGELLALEGIISEISNQNYSGPILKFRNDFFEVS